MTVREAQSRISSREFSEWIAFYILEDEETSEPPKPDVGAKLTAWAAANAHRPTETILVER